MHALAPEISPTAQCLYDLHEDLDRFTSVPVLEGDLDHYQAVYSASPAETNNELYNLIHHAFTGANNVISHYRPVRAVPMHQLAISAVRAAQNSKTPDIHQYSQDLCLGAELKVEKSIELNQAGRGPSHGVAAAVLFDMDGAPFAYSKSVGNQVALAWREAVMDTYSGIKVIPAGSFFSFGYGEDGQLSIQDMTNGPDQYLISLEYSEPPTDVKLFRFSAFLIDQELADSAYQNATSPEAYDYLKDYVPSVLGLGLDGIADQVQTLLRQGHAHRVWTPYSTS